MGGYNFSCCLNILNKLNKEKHPLYKTGFSAGLGLAKQLGINTIYFNVSVVQFITKQNYFIAAVLQYNTKKNLFHCIC